MFSSSLTQYVYFITHEVDRHCFRLDGFREEVPDSSPVSCWRRRGKLLSKEMWSSHQQVALFLHCNIQTTMLFILTRIIVSLRVKRDLIRTCNNHREYINNSSIFWWGLWINWRTVEGSDIYTETTDVHIRICQKQAQNHMYFHIHKWVTVARPATVYSPDSVLSLK